MQGKAGQADDHLQGEQAKTELEKSPIHAGDQRHGQKTHGQSAGDDGNPFHRPKKTILRMVGDTENKIASEAAERKEHDPLRPFTRIGTH